LKEPLKIPHERLYEMDRKLYLVSITVEGLRVVGWLIWTIQMMTRVMKG
jgi:hypothetical protein